MVITGRRIPSAWSACPSGQSGHQDAKQKEVRSIFGFLQKNLEHELDIYIYTHIHTQIYIHTYIYIFIYLFIYTWLQMAIESIDGYRGFSLWVLGGLEIFIEAVSSAPFSFPWIAEHASESLNMHRKLFDEVVGAKCGRKYQLALYRWTIDNEDMLQNRERFSWLGVS